MKDVTQAGLDDLAIEQILRAAGPRVPPPAEAMEEVRAAVQAEWRDVVDSRRRTRRFVSLAAAAGLAAAALTTVWITATGPESGAGGLVASVANETGAVEWRASGEAAWHTLDAAHPVSLHEELRTAASSRVALDVEGGAALRLDEHTSIAFTAPGRITLRRGAVYVDSRDVGDSLVIDTPFGEVTHLGTRYQARLEAGALRVAVRDGTVKVDAHAGEELVGAGELLTLPERGIPTRRPLAAHAPEWDWAVSIAPAPGIEGMSLAAFLDWAGHETGRRVEFVSPEAERSARQVILHGSIEGLAPGAALTAILSTTTLRHELADGGILLSEAAAR